MNRRVTRAFSLMLASALCAGSVISSGAWWWVCPPVKTPAPTVKPVCPTPSSGATIFKDYNFGGASATLQRGAYATHGSLIIGGDLISSVAVANGYKLVAFENENFGGRKWTFTAGNWNVAPEANDIISSIIIVYDWESESIFMPTPKPTCTPTPTKCPIPSTGVTVFKDYNLGGASATLQRGAYATHGSLIIGGDVISSVGVANGYKLVAFENEYFGGRKWTFTAGSWNVAPEANDIISSIIIVYDWESESIFMPTPNPTCWPTMAPTPTPAPTCQPTAQPILPCDYLSWVDLGGDPGNISFYFNAKKQADYRLEVYKNGSYFTTQYVSRNNVNVGGTTYFNAFNPGFRHPSHPQGGAAPNGMGSLMFYLYVNENGRDTLVFSGNDDTLLPIGQVYINR